MISVPPYNLDMDKMASKKWENIFQLSNFVSMFIFIFSGYFCFDSNFCSTVKVFDRTNVLLECLRNERTWFHFHLMRTFDKNTHSYNTQMALLYICILSTSRDRNFTSLMCNTPMRSNHFQRTQSYLITTCWKISTHKNSILFRFSEWENIR